MVRRRGHPRDDVELDAASGSLLGPAKGGASGSTSAPSATARKQQVLKKTGFNDVLSYDGKVYLGRSKKPDGLCCVALLLVLLVFCFGLAYAVYYHFHEFHFHLSHAYARLGHRDAQHLVGERLLHGKGVAKDESLAMEWFRRAADQGHPHASYNLAIGHLSGLKTDVQPGEVHQLIKHAHNEGVAEAADLMKNACRNGICDEE